MSDIINGPFYPNSHTKTADVTDGLSNTVFVGERSSILSNNTWVGVVPGSVVVPRLDLRPWPSDNNGATDIVGCHSGPDVHDHPQVIIHAPNNPFGHTDEMWGEHGTGCNVLFGDGSVRYCMSSMTGGYGPHCQLATLEIRPMVRIDGSDRRRWIAVFTGLSLFVVILGFVLWRLPPPQLGTNEEVFRTVDALFTAINIRSQKQLEECERRFVGYRKKGALPENAAFYLESVIRQARAGKWEPAAKRLYEFMYAQRRQS